MKERKNEGKREGRKEGRMDGNMGRKEGSMCVVPKEVERKCAFGQFRPCLVRQSSVSCLGAHSGVCVVFSTILGNKGTGMVLEFYSILFN
ncbi:hypothetical protein BC939DRAFT_448951 [Gamsiella multidivaricata]|uniref:uncharacterized protein n=1 Tax=Gamsiella multidivaricata TaxID=101098 RepID=UPI00221F6163|nr:uncharacterized protein BC939DRAFT_448951 [Gamsiella multidivaricata]KAI7825181.1 hypothetical protein BC939DRAFT_448951 [Gamsiella multidivaricata]